MGVCVVVGVGPGNGAAFARVFAEQGYRLALLARSTAFTTQLAEELPGSAAIACDASDSASVQQALAEVRAQLGPISVLIWNAGPGVWGSIEEVGLEDFDRAWQVNVRGLAGAVKDALPDLVAQRGNVVVIGATASLRGGARFAAFASAKAAQRSLAQSMARHLGPQGVHVSVVIVDGVIATPQMLQRQPARDPATLIDPVAIARTALALVQQPETAWTFELDLRPAREKW